MAFSDEIDLMGLDDNFNPVTYINFINLQWNRRYYEVGSFTVQILAKDYDERVKYVYAHQRPELGVVERTETQQTVKGDFVLLSGRFFEHVLSWRLAFPNFTGKYTLNALAERFIRDSWYKVRKYDIQLAENLPTDEVEIRWENDPLGECMADTLKTLEMSQRVLFDPDTHALTYHIVKGLDRTQSQSDNPYAVFSDESCYVSSFKYVEDWSDYKNVVMILYGSQPSRRDRYLPGWEEHGGRWMLMNASEEDSAESQKQQADEEMQKHPIVREAEIDVIQNNFFYLKDYDIGDKCDIISHKYGKSFEARLARADEVWKQGQHLITLGFGEQLQTQYQRLKNYVVADRKAH